MFSSNFDDYELQEIIGLGSSAVVHQAIFKPLNKRVAIKVIDLEHFERNQIDELRRETSLMSLSKHENVLRVRGSFVVDSKLYIATRLMAAGSCLDIMKVAHSEGFEEVILATILKQALKGLDYLHKNDYIHRDVKAGNLLMDEDGTVLLADFGVSSSTLETGDRRRKSFVGTPCWMAPEVVTQNGYNQQADIWSFGITAIELATGHAPFAKFPPIKVMMMTLSEESPTLDRNRSGSKHKYSKNFKDLIDQCLQKDPSKRPSAEKALAHPFFKQAKKKEYLKTNLLAGLPPLPERRQRLEQRRRESSSMSTAPTWNFDSPQSTLGDYNVDMHRVKVEGELSVSPSELSARLLKAVSFHSPILEPSVSRPASDTADTAVDDAEWDLEDLKV